MILISDKADFKPKLDRGKNILIKGILHQEVILIINIYALNIGALTQFLKPILLDIKIQIQ
jgi:hypothetical protein